MGSGKGRSSWVVTGRAKWLLLLVTAILALGLITPVVCRIIHGNTPGSAGGGLVRVTASLSRATRFKEGSEYY